MKLVIRVLPFFFTRTPLDDVPAVMNQLHRQDLPNCSAAPRLTIPSGARSKHWLSPASQSPCELLLLAAARHVRSIANQRHSLPGTVSQCLQNAAPLQRGTQCNGRNSCRSFRLARHGLGVQFPRLLLVCGP